MTRMVAGAFFAALFGIATSGIAAEPSSRPGRTTRPATTEPDYPIPYQLPRIANITRILRAVKGRIERTAMTSFPTPAATAASNSRSPNRFALNVYPMGVIYSGMLAAAEATGDHSFDDYDASKFSIIASAAAKLDLAHLDHHAWDVTSLLNPKSLDDCGAIGAAMIKARRANIGPDLGVEINRIANFIRHGQLRLDDGTLAREHPFKDSIWADDAYMSIPFLAQMGALTGDRQYFDDAAAQMLHFSNYLFIPSSGLFTHHWNTSNPDDQPRYYWGRANGWCSMAFVELLEVLPRDHPLRAHILRLFRAHSLAIASAQAGDGLWHQMLDRTDTYTETSCSAMFVYALARGVNRGWLSAEAYGPVAIAGWNGLSTRISPEGNITGTCVGTGYGDDYVFYYHRPTVDDIHAYGPVLLAGSETIQLLKTHHFRDEHNNAVMLIDPKFTTSRPENP